MKDLCYFLWSIIGVVVLGLFIVLGVEFVNHGANWKGIYKAHILHMNNAYNDIITEY